MRVGGVVSGTYSADTMALVGEMATIVFPLVSVAAELLRARVRLPVLARLLMGLSVSGSKVTSKTVS